VGITEHDLSSGKKVIILVNCTPADRKVTLNLKSGWITEKALYGAIPFKSIVSVPANDACVLQIGRN
jgi:hypothetical protein